MSSRLRIAGGAAAAVATIGIGGVATAQAAAQPPLARPNPALVAVRLDYVGPIPDPRGGSATLEPLLQSVIPAAISDQEFLVFQTVDDLGGFKPASPGIFAGSSGGHNLVGRQGGASQIPQFAQAAGGKVTSFAAVGAGTFVPPDQGLQPVPGLGTPPPVAHPSNGNTVPPPNQGFGGTPTRKPPPTTTTSPSSPPTSPPTTTRPTPTTTRPTPTTTTTTPTTTAAPEPSPSPTTQAPPPPPFIGASCGTAGLSITSDHSTCRITAVNMAPGGSASEVMTIRNDTSEPFTLALRADGTQSQLWQDLRLGVWEVGTGAPAPLPPLLFWTTQANQLATLQAGETIRYEIELFLPTSAGNGDQAIVATIDLVWSAQG